LTVIPPSVKLSNNILVDIFSVVVVYHQKTRWTPPEAKL